ncbi:MAG: hypothetical protein I3273_04200 [Candidatus Moeniiplasma glomeromycotorum]|nr:hypothetical protein [Candidatus Moeniiplasma glomeromycotorum]
MFKGFNKKFQKQLEICNRDSEYFVFSFMDLELVEVDGRKRKMRIIDEELSKELNKLVSPESPKISFIEFKTYGNSFVGDEHPAFLNFSEKLDSIKWWLKVYKDENNGLHKHLKNFKVSQDGTLSIDYFNICTSVKDTSRSYDIYASVYDNKYEVYSDKPWNKIEGFAVNGGYAEIHPDYHAKIIQTQPARHSAKQIIKDTIQKGNIDFTTLKEAMLFLGESYINAWPTDCLYCPNEYVKNPENFSEYHKTHIDKCLWRPDRINEFKDKQISLIQSIINKFNDYKNQVIKEIIQKAKNQGITQEQLNATRPSWQNHLLSLKNRKEIEDYQKECLDKYIERLVVAKNQNTEKEKKQQDTEETAKREEERLKEEQEKNKKVTEEVNENLKKATNPNATVQEKKDALENLDKNEGESSYEGKKKEIKEIKKEVARDNPSEYRDKIVSDLNKKLTKNGLKEKDLDNQTQQEIKDLKDGKELEPNELVEIEAKLTEKIGQKEAKKKMDDLILEVGWILEDSGKRTVSKESINDLKKQLLKIIDSNSVYYLKYKDKARQLLQSLEKISLNNLSVSQPSKTLSLKAKIGIGIVVVLIVGFFIYIMSTQPKQPKWMRGKIKGKRSKY